MKRSLTLGLVILISVLMNGCSNKSNAGQNVNTVTEEQTVQNTLPIANAGSDKLFVALRNNKIVEVNDTLITDVGVEKINDLTIHLDGRSSLDADGDPLSYQWKVVEAPEGSQAVLTGDLTALPILAVDRLGDYVLELTVNDGTSNSSIDRVTVSLKTYMLDRVSFIDLNNTMNTSTIRYSYTFDETYQKIFKIYGEDEGNSSVYYDETQTYDSYGNLASYDTNSSAGTWNEESWTYDEAGHLLVSHEADSDGWYEDVQNGYDESGKLVESNLTSRNLPSGWKMTYEYDAEGNLITIDRDVGNGNRWISRYEYDTNGKKIKGYNVNSSVESTSVYSYDERGNLIEFYTENTNDDAWSKGTYTYNAVNKVLTDRYENSAGSLNIETYTYNADNQKLTYREEDQSGYWDMYTATYDEFSYESTLLYENSNGEARLSEYSYKLIPE